MEEFVNCKVLLVFYSMPYSQKNNVRHCLFPRKDLPFLYGYFCKNVKMQVVCLYIQTSLANPSLKRELHPKILCPTFGMHFTFGRSEIIKSGC